MPHRTNHSDAQAGFTLIELMIATAIFAVIMLIAATTVIYVSKTYVKGEVEAQTQQTTRNILTTISQDIQYNNGASVSVPPGQTQEPFYFCAGDHVYLYDLDYELAANPPPGQPMYAAHDLIVYNNPDSANSCPSLANRPTFGPTGIVSASGAPIVSYGPKTQELLSPHQRLDQLTVSQVACVTGAPICNDNTYTISLTVAYGDDDVLGDPANYGARPTPTSPAAHYNFNCTQQEYGGNFCAVSSLTTTVESRIN